MTVQPWSWLDSANLHVLRIEGEKEFNHKEPSAAKPQPKIRMAAKNAKGAKKNREL